MRRPRVRDDLRALEGYHSPQVDVEVRLNTNESPDSPPAAWRDAFAAELSRVDWHRYPDRGAAALRTAIADLHRVGSDQVFAANGSNEVLQTLLLAYGGPGRSALTFEPTYQLHSHIARLTATTVVEAERTSEFELDLTDAKQVITEVQPAITFLCSPNNPTGMVETEATVRSVASWAPGLVVVDEAYGQFAPWSALCARRRGRCRWSSRARSRRRGRWPRRGSATSWGRRGSSPSSTRSPCRTTSTRRSRSPVCSPSRSSTRWRNASPAWCPSASGSSLGSAISGRRCGRRVRTSCCSASRSRGDEIWQGLLDRSVLVRNCSSWPRLDDCLRVTIGTPQENDRFL